MELYIKLYNSRWLTRASSAPFVTILLIVMISGTIWYNLASFVWFVCILFSIVLGEKFARFIILHFLKNSGDFTKQLITASILIVLLFLPAAVVSWMNIQLSIDIGITPLSLHFAFACTLGICIGFSYPTVDQK